MDKITQSIKRTAHGSNDNVTMLANQGASAFMSGSTQFPGNNPLSKTGNKVIQSMEREYGKEKGKKVFYATMNKKGSKWHK